MKKKILSLICGVAMAATMFSSFVVASAADAPTLKIVTDAADSANIKAGDTFNVSVVLDGLEGLAAWNGKTKAGTGVTSLQFVLFMPDNEYITSGSEVVCAGAVSNWEEVEGGWNLSVAFAGTQGNMISSVPYTIATVDFTANKDVDAEQVFKIVDTEVAAVTKQVFASGALSSTDKFEIGSTLATPTLTIGEAPAPQPTIETTPATAVDSAALDENEVIDETSADAKAYIAEVALTSDSTVVWTATNGTKEIPAVLANIDATTKLGLVVLGDAASLGDIAVKVTTPAAAN